MSTEPNRHSLVEQRQDASGAWVPMDLDDVATFWRGLLDSAQPEDTRLGRGGDADVVYLTTTRARAIATLLSELAARLRLTDTAVGPIRSTGAASELAAELAKDLHRRAWR